MAKHTIWIIDTSVFLNILDIPGYNQKRKSIISDFKIYIKMGIPSFFLIRLF